MLQTDRRTDKGFIHRYADPILSVLGIGFSFLKNRQIDFDEFSTLMRWLNRYDEIKKLFQQLDTDKDHRISFGEFEKGHELLNLNTQLLQLKFNSIDRNHSGYIIFDEVNYFSCHKYVYIYTLNSSFVFLWQTKWVYNTWKQKTIFLFVIYSSRILIIFYLL